MPAQGKSRRKKTADTSQGDYVNQWNRLVSTTNWEKGRIISEWREELETSGAPSSKFSDDAWAELVGGVTGQHVGRLRRVYQQFGDVWEDYPGLFWSHFQVAGDWDDAEMWLEGAVQNGWSVSQMRAGRWEAYGAAEELKPREEDVVLTELDEDSLQGTDELEPVTSRTATVRDPDSKDKPAESKGKKSSENTTAKRATASEEATAAPKVEKTKRKQPFADLPKLPPDVAEAFEQFKLVILNHKLAEWKEIARDDLLASLDALKELALQPAE